LSGTPGGAGGAGVGVSAGRLTLVNVTVAYNAVAGGGSAGGLDIAAGATATLDNTLVALNTSGTGSGALASDITGAASPASSNDLIGIGGSGGLVNGVNANEVGVANPVLGTLANNGGPTETIALLPGSPAIGAGSDAIPGVTVPTTDQRGVARPPSSIDIGAFQDRGFVITIVTGESPQTAAINTAFSNPLAVYITSPYGDPVQGGLVAFAVTPSPSGASADLSAGSATIGAGGLVSVTANANGKVGNFTTTVSALGAATPATFALSNVAEAARVTGVTVDWGIESAPLQTAADGIRLLPAGRNTDLPWLGIDQLPITLSQAATLTSADVTVASDIGVNYGPVTISGSGTSYTITLAQPINQADRVTVTINGPGLATYTRRLDVLPGDVNDDGVVDSQDLVLVRNMWLGITPATIFGDINGAGVVNGTDYNDVRARIGTTLPPVGGDGVAEGGSADAVVVGGGGDAAVSGSGPTGAAPLAKISPNGTKSARRPATQPARPRAEIQLASRGRSWSLGNATRTRLVNPFTLEQL
jgi:Dockerin type I domain